MNRYHARPMAEHRRAAGIRHAAEHIAELVTLIGGVLAILAVVSLADPR